MRTRHVIFTLLLGVFALGAPSRVAAGTITVNTLIDESDGSCTDGDCSLRDAIAVADDGDTIDLGVTGTLVVTQGAFLSISENLTINGPGAGSLTIRREVDTVIFYLASSADAHLSGVTVSGRGGGIYIDWGGRLAVTDCTFSTNGGRGAIENRGTLTVTRCTFSGNSATLGGAIENRGTLAATHSTFAGNHADMSGGAIENWDGIMTVSHCTFSDNRATSDGGAIDNDGALTVADSAFLNNEAGRWGGGIEVNAGTVAISNSSFSDNSAATAGGGIDNWGSLEIARSSFSGNSAADGGGLKSFGPVDMTSSTFSGNDASHWGGGIQSSGALDATNCTFWGNSAGNEGGGIHIAGTLRLTNSTLFSNGASEGGGLCNLDFATLRNTIIAGSTGGGDCCAHELFTGASRNNLASDDTCSPSFSQVTPTQLALGPLTGSPAYMPLNAGSVAIDTGTNDGCPATDQRGWRRPRDGDGDGVAICDVGSYELSTLARGWYLPLVLR